MADIVDRDVVVLTPEEGDCIKFLTVAEHVESRGLALALGYHPVLEAYHLAEMGIGPPRDVAGGEDRGLGGLEIGVHGDAAVGSEPRGFSERDPWAHANSGDHEISFEPAAALELHLLAVDASRHVFEVENHAVLLVQRADEIAHLRPENPLHRPLVRRPHMDPQSAGAERSRDLEPDKARTHDHRPACRLGIVDDRLAVAERAERVHVWLVGAGDREANRLGPRCQQQSVVGDRAPIRELDLPPPHIDAGDFRLEPQIDTILGIEALRPQRDPILLSVSGEVVLGQIRPVYRRCIVVAQNDDTPLVMRAPQHLGCSKAGGASAAESYLNWSTRRWLPAWLRFRLRQLLAHENLAVLLLHLPARHRTQGRCAQGLTGAQIEAGMMPRAADGIADHEPVSQRAVVMRALRPDREHVVPAADDQDGVTADVPDELAAVGKVDQ